MTDARLAHVVLVARPDVAAALDRSGHPTQLLVQCGLLRRMPAFRARRSRMVVDFIQEAEVATYLQACAPRLNAQDTAEVCSDVLPLLGENADTGGGYHWRSSKRPQEPSVNYEQSIRSRTVRVVAAATDSGPRRRGFMEKAASGTASR